MEIKSSGAEIYTFDAQLKIGEEYENKIDLYFSKFYEIEKVSMELQKQGIDRIFRDKDRLLKIEYKSDEKALKTGNIFIETYSMKPQKKGWAHTSKSDFIIYYVVGDAVYVMPTGYVRDTLDMWQALYRTVNCQNKDYESEGILVPILDIKRIFKRLVID